MSKSWFWGECLTLLVCLCVALPLHAAGAAGGFEKRIAEAVRLYEDLEYELALAELERAGKEPHGAEDAVTLALYKGIISADFGQWEAARTEFRSVLLRKPNARLPLRVSPKVEREFETQRTRAREELARRPKDSPRLTEPPLVESGAGADSKVLPPSTGPVAEAPRPELVPAPVPEVAAGGPSGEVARSRRVPVLSLVLLGAGVAAGGVGTVFGWSSRGQLEDARSAQFRADLVEHHGQAQRSARTANILFGTAAATTAGAVVTWLLMGDSEAVAQGGAR